MRIPSSIEDAVLDLKGLGELVTASEWKRAAIVWAFTTDQANGRGNRISSDALSARAFAGLAVTGLSSQNTIRKYRKAWSKAITDGIATDVRPGELINLPDAEWQDYFNPKLPQLERKKTPAKRHTLFEAWDETAWDADALNTNKRVVRMSEVMFETVEGVGDEKLDRVAQSILDFVSDENKARGLARMMHAVIELASEYRTAQLDAKTA